MIGWLDTIERHNLNGKPLAKRRQVEPLLRLLESHTDQIEDAVVKQKVCKFLQNLKSSHQETLTGISHDSLNELASTIKVLIECSKTTPTTNKRVDRVFLKRKLESINSHEYYVVFDLEMTVPFMDSKEFRREIIEIGAVILDRELNEVNQFQTLIKPTINRELSSLCTRITGIKQSDVKRAPDFKDAFASFIKFLSVYTHSCLFVQFGSGDYNQLKKDCNLHGIQTQLNHTVLNIKHLSSVSGKVGRKHRSLEKMLVNCGIERNGVAHRALNDAIDTANLLRVVIEHVEKITS